MKAKIDISTDNYEIHSTFDDSGSVVYSYCEQIRNKKLIAYSSDSRPIKDDNDKVHYEEEYLNEIHEKVYDILRAEEIISEN